jgi:hypothetical protein
MAAAKSRVFSASCRSFFIPDFSNLSSFVFFVRFVVDSCPPLFPLRIFALSAFSALKKLFTPKWLVEVRSI